MSGPVTAPVPDRLCRQARVSGYRLLWVVLLSAGMLGLAGGAGWWWQIAPAYRLTLQAQEGVQALELELALMGGRTDAHVQGVAAPTPELARADDDVSALVRWHDLLREHQLRDWQGRSVPSARTPGASEADRAEGLLWRLEGTATYEQGVALLQSMARSFPRLVLLLVQVQQLPASDLLQWRLELRWSTSATGVAQRWPPGGRFDTRHDINPFALSRVQPDVTTGHPVDRAQAGGTHVLPQAPLQEIRLIGVMGGEDERLAVVVWAPPSGHASGTEHTRSTSTPHRLRRGQTLGLEQTRVVAVAPRSVVLQSSRRVAPGRLVERREVLALVTPELELLATEGLRP